MLELKVLLVSFLNNNNNNNNNFITLRSHECGINEEYTDI